ncbi:MAG: arginase family protein [Candidatus Diapherotrites archaeon]|nr:arginase family protein [Candidatus Diapherotrites archaeon]
MRVFSFKIHEGSLGYNNGTEKAPEKILEKLNLRSSKEFDGSLDRIQKESYLEAKKILNKEEFLFSVGGDHSITYPLFKAFSEAYGRDYSHLIILDAHADCWEFIKPVAHEDYVKVLIDEKYLNPENLLEIGIRHTWKAEEKFLEKKKIKVIRGKDMKSDFQGVLKQLREFLEASENIYLSVDFDFMDKEIAFATGWPETQGASLEQTLEIIDLIMNTKKVKAADYVEYNPTLDKNDVGLNASLKIVNKILTKAKT